MELHQCGTEILAHKTSDRTAEALQRLPRLHQLRDRLLNELKALLQQN
jgi:hypothetical protein